MVIVFDLDSVLQGSYYFSVMTISW